MRKRLLVPPRWTLLFPDVTHSFVTAVTTILSCLRIQRVNDLSTQRLLGSSDFSESALTCTHCSEKWQREVRKKQMKSKPCVLKTKYWDRSSVWPSNLWKPQGHRACPAQNPATPLLTLTCTVSFYCRVNSNNQTEHPCLVQHPALSGNCTRNRINGRKNPHTSKQPPQSLLLSASTNKPHSWAVHSSLCASGCT